MEDFWNSLCSDLNVGPAVASEWLANIAQQYSEPHRFFHNEKFMLEKKLEFLVNCRDKAVVLATIFHYFYHDNRGSSCEKNCDTFELFVEQAGITDVSIL
jgi:hypothetical protein